MNPQDDVVIVIKRNVFDYIMNVLSQRPFAEVAGLMQTLAQQAAPPAPEIPPGNGAMKDPSAPTQ